MAMDFATKFRGYVRTATPLIKVDTFDARATMRHIIEVMGETKLLDSNKTMLSVTGISQWDICRGFNGVNELGIAQVTEFLRESKTPPAALHMAENLYKVLAAVRPEVLRDHFTFVFNAHKFWGNAVEVQGLYNLRDILADKGSMLILLSAPGEILPQELAQDIMPLDEPLPDDKQVEAIITKAYANAKVLATASKKKIPEALPARCHGAFKGSAQRDAIVPHCAVFSAVLGCDDRDDGRCRVVGSETSHGLTACRSFDVRARWSCACQPR